MYRIGLKENVRVNKGEAMLGLDSLPLQTAYWNTTLYWKDHIQPHGNDKLSSLQGV
jgi:hypothetical protein